MTDDRRISAERDPRDLQSLFTRQHLSAPGGLDDQLLQSIGTQLVRRIGEADTGQTPRGVDGHRDLATGRRRRGPNRIDVRLHLLRLRCAHLRVGHLLLDPGNSRLGLARREEVCHSGDASPRVHDLGQRCEKSHVPAG